MQTRQSAPHSPTQARTEVPWERPFTSGAQEGGLDTQAAVHVLARLLRLLIDVLILHGAVGALAAVKDILVRDGSIQALPGNGNAALDEGPVLM